MNGGHLRYCLHAWLPVWALEPVNTELWPLSLESLSRLRVLSSLSLVDLLSHLSTELPSTSVLHSQFQLSFAPSSYQRLLFQPVPFTPKSIFLPHLTSCPTLVFRAVMVIIHLLTHFTPPVLPLTSFPATLFSVASVLFLFSFVLFA